MEELNELKNLVIQTLEANGSLSNIRAQIRSSVFKVIDEPNTQKKVSPFHWENVKCQKLHEEEYGLDLLLVIKEFFQFYNMDYTNCVFASEANARTEVKRDQLIEKLGLTGKVEAGKPILIYIIEKFRSGGCVAPAPAAAGSKKMKSDHDESIEEEYLERGKANSGAGMIGESQEFGDSHGYDRSVDSTEIENYDYAEEVRR